MAATVPSGTEPPVRPPYNPAFEPFLTSDQGGFRGELSLEAVRQGAGGFTAEQITEKFPSMVLADHTAPGLKEGSSAVTLAVLQSKSSTNTDRPAIYFVHGGGQVAGHRFAYVAYIMQAFEDVDAVLISVEYRLAPEHRAPSALEDSYAGLLWAVDHATELRIDTSKIIIAGLSGGGPIAAATTMLCRNNKKTFPLAQMITAPMLDDRDCTVSAKQYETDGPWCGAMNRMAWDLVLGRERGGPDVSELVSPARATDLAGLPNTFLDVGECEVFRDETVAFASQLWKCGVSAELHVWPGAHHAFDLMTPDAPVAVASLMAKKSWVERILVRGHIECSASK